MHALLFNGLLKAVLRREELLWLTQIWINQNLITSPQVALGCITHPTLLPTDCKSTVGHFEILWLPSLWPMAKISDKGTICCNSLHIFMPLNMKICTLALGKEIICGQEKLINNKYILGRKAKRHAQNFTPQSFHLVKPMRHSLEDFSCWIILSVSSVLPVMSSLWIMQAWL